MQTIQLDNKLDKNHIIFRHNNKYYSKNILGDDVDNVFKENLMNIYLNQYEETIGRITYHDIVYISVLYNYDEVIRKLPNNLIGLFVMSSTCTTLTLSEQVKQTIQNIHLDKTNINSFPNIDGCNKLRQLKIIHSNISSFNINYDLPLSLDEFILSGNKITNANFAYDKLRVLINTKRFCRISFSDNYLKYDLFPSDISPRCNLIRQDTYKHNIIRRNNVPVEHIQNIIQNIQDGGNINVGIASQLLSSQSVHLSSINKSVVKSIEVILEYINVNKINVDEINVDEFLYFMNNYIHFDFNFSCVTEHSITKLTYKKTFDMIWTVMQHLISTGKFEKNDLYERLAQEIKDSIGYCFTGRYNRLINSLVGILDGVQIGISKNEEIQLEFERLIKKIKGNETPDEFSNIVCEAKEILVNSDNKNVWLSALNDYAPESISIIYEDKEYLKTWDDLIILNDDVVATVINEQIIFFSN